MVPKTLKGFLGDTPVTATPAYMEGDTQLYRTYDTDGEFMGTYSSGYLKLPEMKPTATVYHTVPEKHSPVTNLKPYTVVSYRIYGTQDMETRLFYVHAESAERAASEVYFGDEWREWTEGNTHSRFYPVVAVLFGWHDDAIVTERKPY
jgi:hypothetical protein